MLQISDDSERSYGLFNIHSQLKVSEGDVTKMSKQQFREMLGQYLKPVLNFPIVGQLATLIIETEYVVPTIVRNFFKYVKTQFCDNLRVLQINYSVPQGIDNTSSDCCPICLSQIQEGVTGFPCHHSYCGGCVIGYWKSRQNNRLRCPICRTDIRRFERNFKVETTSEERLLTMCDSLMSYNSWFFRFDLFVIPSFVKTIFNIIKQAIEIGKFLKNLVVVLWLSILILYILSPIDMVPELYFGLLGLIDDCIALMMLVGLLTWIRILQ